MIPERLTQLPLNTKSLPLPVYFPSISSVKTALPPQDYLHFLSSLASLNRQFLVSAFDLAALENTKHITGLLSASNEAGAITLMDSGNYESFWKAAQTNWHQTDYHRMLKTFPCDLAFSFDEQHPPADAAEHVALVRSLWEADQEAAGSCLIVPIVHATAVALPTLVAAVAAEASVVMVAVPERKLGDGIIERARVVKAIRSELSKLDRYVALHLLGTGNPLSIALYASMGADSFDGLEWCQTVVDHDSAQLHHLSHADFFARQTKWEDAGLSFQARTLVHNLEFYTEWMKRLRTAIADDRGIEFCQLHFPARIFQHCAQAVGWSQ